MYVWARLRKESEGRSASPSILTAWWSTTHSSAKYRMNIEHLGIAGNTVVSSHDIEGPWGEVFDVPSTASTTWRQRYAQWISSEGTVCMPPVWRV
jgi:hypothetical protein